MAVTSDPRRALDRANVKLAKELFVIKASLDIYGLVGLNADRIQSGKVFFGHIQYVSHQHVALGLAKVFERPKEGHHLCSIVGLYRLAMLVPLQDPSALRSFVATFGVEPSGDWARDAAAVLIAVRPMLREHLREVYRARNTQIAHLQLDAPSGDLPSIAAFEELLAFAVAFHDVINGAFLGTSSHPILRDRKVADNLTRLLKATGLVDVVRDFPD